jgi:hypothetical protein
VVVVCALLTVLHMCMHICVVLQDVSTAVDDFGELTIRTLFSNFNSTVRHIAIARHSAAAAVCYACSVLLKSAAVQCSLC